MKKYSCIIPHYNEWPRILEVIKIIEKVTKISQIICVDDWSEEKHTMWKNIKEYSKKISAYRVPHWGKTKAIKFWLKKADHNDIILLDADLQNLSQEELENAIQYYEDKKFEMLIMVSSQPRNYIKYTNRHITLSWQRILKKSILETIVEERKPENYQLETAINSYAIEKDLLIGFCPMSFKNTQKTEKKEHSKVCAILKNIQMHVEIINYTGIAHYSYVSLLIIFLYNAQRILPFNMYKINAIILFNVQYVRYIFQHIV